MSKRVLVLIGLFLACGGVYSQTATGTKTNFQTAESWKPETDVRADAVRKALLLSNAFNRGETKGTGPSL